MAKKKMTYYFGKTRTDGDGKQKQLLGGKGANLAEMTGIGLPVPPGFTITTECCDEYYKAGKKLPPGLMDQVDSEITTLEKELGKKFGDDKNPLLVSVRSGAAVSMPGMMNTILNLGLTDKSVRGPGQGHRQRAVCLRRLSPPDQHVRRRGDGGRSRAFRRGFRQDQDQVQGRAGHRRAGRGPERTVRGLQEGLQETLRQRFPAGSRRAAGAGHRSGLRQLEHAARRALPRSREHSRPAGHGRQRPVDGLRQHGRRFRDRASAFTRNPSTGENKFYGEFLVNAQGEDVVAGIRTPQPVAEMPKWNKPVYKQLLEIKKTLEEHYRDMQDIEFTIERGKLFMLQTRTGKRTGAAAVKIACDMVKEKLIDEKDGRPADSGQRPDAAAAAQLRPDGQGQGRQC